MTDAVRRFHPDGPPGKGLERWEEMDPAELMSGEPVQNGHTYHEIEAEGYLAGVRKFPTLVPILPAGKPDRLKGDAAWASLEASDLPVLTAFSDSDAVSRGGEQRFINRLKNVKNVTIKGGGHFLQDDQPESLSAEIIKFMRGL